MNTINDEFDVVIKIKKIDNYRLRPQKSAITTEPITNKSSVLPNISSNNLDGIEKKIYTVIENEKIGVKAKDIANKLRISRTEVNHYLYNTLKEYVKIDNDYKWYVVKSAHDSVNSSSILKQDVNNYSKSSKELESINFNLLKNEDVLFYVKMFDNLVISHRNGLNAPHKYILLISLFTLIGNGHINSNKFGSTKEIEEEFNKTWNRLVPKDVPFNSKYTTPFWYLASEKFWNVYTSDGKSVDSIWDKPIISINRQRKELSAIIDFDLYNIILDNEIRCAIIAHLESIVRKGLKLK